MEELRYIGRWQPIETVPKDGRTVLLFCNYVGSREVTIARYVADHGHPGPHGAFVWKHPLDGGASAEKVATHWMPLPEPPGGHLKRS